VVIDLQELLTAKDAHHVHEETASQPSSSAFTAHSSSSLVICSIKSFFSSYFFASSILVILSQAKIDGGRDLASAIVLHPDLTAKDAHHVHEETASQLFSLVSTLHTSSSLVICSMKSFFSSSSFTSSSSEEKLSQAKIDGGRDFASLIVLHPDLTAKDAHHVHEVSASQRSLLAFASQPF